MGELTVSETVDSLANAEAGHSCQSTAAATRHR